MRTFLKYLLLIFVLSLPASNALGQKRNIQLYKIDKDDNEDKKGGTSREKKAEEGIYIYSFNLKSSAEKAYKKLKDHQALELEKQDDFLDSVTTKSNEDFVSLEVPVRGWLLISDIDNDSHILREFTKDDDTKSLVKIKLEGGSAIKLGPVFKTAYRGAKRKNASASASSCGGVLILEPYPVIIDSVYARNNARFVLSPIVISRQNPKDTIGFLPPRVIDGVDYDPSQVRFMGFDQTSVGNQLFNKNDIYYKNKNVFGEEPMSNYFNKGMKARQQDTIYFQCKIRPYDDKHPWKIIGHYWYEDYKTVYYENNMLLYAGYSKDPTQFLEWRSSIPKVELDENHYFKKALTEPVEDSKELKLMFKVNQPTLDFTDSITNVSIDDMTRLIQNILDKKEARIHNIAIHGFASPEGPQAKNDVLAMRRAQTVRSLFAEKFPDRYNVPLSVPTYNIVPWTEVADTLEAINADGYAEMAREIREICKQYTKLDDQYTQIKKKGYHTKLGDDKIYDRMRRVRITTAIIEHKELTDEEILQKYKANREGFLGDVTPAYQYYKLMNLLYQKKDWDALQHVAQKAYDSGDVSLREETTRAFMTDSIQKIEIDKETGKRDTIFIVKDTIKIDRPYPLAAYYLAKSKLEKGIIDTLTLKDYLDRYANRGEYFVKNNGKIWNEEAIAITQILMYCLAKKYNEAYILSQYHLPDNENYMLFKYFIKYLSCDYTQEEKEIMRKAIETTSSANFVAVNLTDERDPEDGNKTGFQRAKEKLLKRKKDFIHNDVLDESYYYLLAICRFQTDCEDKDYETYYYDSKNVYDPLHLFGESSPFIEINKDDHWGAPMIEAFKANPQKWPKALKEDGFFNDAYRSMLLFFWQRMQDGAEMADIAKEYDTLAKKYFKPEKQQSNSKKR